MSEKRPRKKLFEVWPEGLWIGSAAHLHPSVAR